MLFHLELRDALGLRAAAERAHDLGDQLVDVGAVAVLQLGPQPVDKLV